MASSGEGVDILTKNHQASTKYLGLAAKSNDRDGFNNLIFIGVQVDKEVYLAASEGELSCRSAH